MDTSAARQSALGCFVLPVRDRRVLVARHTYGLGDTWALIGGTAEPGETAATAAHREAREETGLDVQIGPLLACADRGDLLLFVFAGTVVGGEEHPQADEIKELRWFSESELAGEDVFELIRYIVPAALDGGGLVSHSIRWPDGSEHSGQVPGKL